MDLRYFLIFFSFVIMEFGLLFYIILDTGDNSDQIGFFRFFIVAFRLSTGDFDLDPYKTISPFSLLIIAWINWILAVLILNFVLMNFIIAVISDSYSKIMQKVVGESFRVRAELIGERELHFDQKEFNNKKLFPRYLILRRPDINDNTDETQQFDKFKKEIKNTIQELSKKTMNELQTQFKSEIGELK